jgi:hypothetical protein
LKNDDVDYLLSTRAIREKAAQVFELTKAGQGSFTFHPDKMAPTIDFVMQIIRKNYPDMKVPFHSRWRHFTAGGIDRAEQLDSVISSADAMERARIKLDLVITSVLLDAGAGPQWSYREKESGKTFSRSEGLGVASFHMFTSGAMSSDGSPRADAKGLRAIRVTDLTKHFQVSNGNPLVGLEGRVQLLNNLAKAVGNTKIFNGERPGHILDYLKNQNGKEIPATAILRGVLD